MSHILERVEPKKTVPGTASAAQIAANRENAKRSTGPRTVAGKRRSATNAMRHGLTAARPVLPGENPRQYRALVNQIRRRFSPQTAMERELCQRIAHLCWKLRRAPGAEAHLLRRNRESMFDECATRNWHRPEEDRVRVRRYHPAGIIAEGFYRGESKSLERLQSYETRIERSLHHAIRTLIALQKTSENEPNLHEAKLPSSSAAAGNCELSRKK